MEKRTIFAVILSILVLWLWAALAPRPSQQALQQNAVLVAQPIDSKDVMASISAPSASSATTPTSTLQPAPEVLQNIATEDVATVATNIGGSLKSVSIPRYKHPLPITDIFSLKDQGRSVFTASGLGSNTARYLFSDATIRVEKTYSPSQDNRIIRCTISITNISSQPITRDIVIDAFTIDTTELEPNASNQRDRSLFEYSIASESGIVRKGNAFQFSPKNFLQALGMVKWAGFRDRYFCAIVQPEFKATGYATEPIDKQRLRVSLIPEKLALEPGASALYAAKIFVGPQDIDLLKRYDFDGIIVYSGVGLFHSISYGITRLLAWMHRLIPSWGLCIILISIMIYLILSPLTFKGMRSMKKMQQLQPQIAKIRDQYKNNPQRLNKEIMELYKENKVNPFGGCLPLLLQMPVFIGLYQALWRSVALKGASFLWIKDLAEPDRLIVFTRNLPIIGNELNILPIVMAIVMYIQQKMTTANMATADPNQAAQQKMMTLFFPVFLGVIFYKFASGLNLYFTVFYVLSIFTQMRMSKLS